MLPRLLHKVAAAAQPRRERSIAHVACGARAAAVPRDALEPRAPRTVSEHPVALHATAARGGDAPAQVEPPKRRAAQHGAAAAACIPHVCAELAQQQRPRVVVLTEQPEQMRHEDERVIVEHHHPAHTSACDPDRAARQLQRGQEAVLRGEGALAVRRAVESRLAAAARRWVRAEM